MAHIDQAECLRLTTTLQSLENRRGVAELSWCCSLFWVQDLPTKLIKEVTLTWRWTPCFHIFWVGSNPKIFPTLTVGGHCADLVFPPNYGRILKQRQNNKSWPPRELKKHGSPVRKIAKLDNWAVWKSNACCLLGFLAQLCAIFWHHQRSLTRSLDYHDLECRLDKPWLGFSETDFKLYPFYGVLIDDWVVCWPSWFDHRENPWNLSCLAWRKTESGNGSKQFKTS